MLEPREANLTIDLCLRVGELLLSSGAGAADVTATMQGLSRELGMRHAEIDITFTSLAMSYQADPEEPALGASRQVNHRAIDYDHLTQVDHLVRRVLDGDLDVRGARAELARIVSTGHDRRRFMITAGWGLMCGGVAIQLGGDLVVIALAILSSVLIDRVQLRMQRRRMPSFYQQVVGGGVATLLALGVGATPLQVNVSLVVTANIIMLLAGIGFMGALQDALTGFYVTASARLLEAFLATAGIIAGVTGGLSVATVLGVRIPQLEPGVADLQTLGMLAVGSAIAAATFAYATYAPRRILAPVALVAGLAMLISRVIELADVGRAWSVGVAAVFVGLVSFTVAGRIRVPPLVVVVPAIVPMLPGLLIYRGLTLLSEGGSATSQGLLAMAGAISVALALASGVILGEYIAQPLKREAARVEARLSGPRLVGPVHAASSTRRRRRKRAEAAREAEAEAEVEADELG